MACFDETEGAHKGRQARHSVEPSRDGWHSLLEASVKAGLECCRKETSQVDVDDSDLVADDPGLVRTIKSSVDASKLILETLDSVVVLVLEWGQNAKLGMCDDRNLWLHLRESKGHPLFYLGLLKRG